MDHTLRIAALDAGFFANVNNVISVLSTSLGKDGARAARIDWTVRPNMSDFSYGDVGTNVWDRFFEPLRFDDGPAAEIDAPVFPDYSISDVYAYRLYKRDRLWRQRLHGVFDRFVKPLPHVKARVDSIAKSTFAGSKVIGVHARHPGISTENLFDVPPPLAFVASARRLMGSDPGAKVFLATDTAATAKLFEEAFGDRLVLQAGVERTLGATQVHHDPIASEQRALQVLTDALLLARCDALVHVTSNIATAVGYINPNLEMHFCESRPRAVIGNAVAAMMRVRAVGHGIRALRRAKYGPR